MSPTLWIVLGAICAIVLVILLISIRVIPEYQRGVAFRFGRIRPLYGAGIRLVLPIVDSLTRVDLRVVTLTIPPQDVITKDNVPARVNAVVLFKVTDPLRAVMEVENYAVATSQIAQTTLRSLLGRVDLDALLAHRDELNRELRAVIDQQTEPWGIAVSVVEIKDIETPEAMQRAMAREAEAERERRAKVINAHGELQASEELTAAAKTLSQSPASLQLRYLQTLLELGADQNSTVVFPLPIDIIGPFLRDGVDGVVGALKGQGGSAPASSAAESTASPSATPSDADAPARADDSAGDAPAAERIQAVPVEETAQG